MNTRNQDIQDNILEQALVDVPFDGWTWDGVETAATRAGYEKDVAHAVFLGGLPDVLAHFSNLMDRQMMAALKDVNPGDLKVRERIKIAVEKRLEVMTAHKEAVRAASVYWLSPFRKLQVGKIVWRTADEIWRWAGDTATDYNHYSKRTLLCGVLTSTTLFWLNDTSEGHAESIEFLDRRIENVLSVGKAIGKFKGLMPTMKRKAQDHV